ncbi:hypothetical protein [Gracilibacillus oryzae]|nr:hypothetical protein [Gracilibacillus oryzae]
MSLMQPEGELTLYGETTNISFDYYQGGNLVRLNSYLETELSI